MTGLPMAADFYIIRGKRLNLVYTQATTVVTVDVSVSGAE